MTVERRRVVAVIGSGTSDFDAELAEAVGREVAHQGWHLLTGGGRGVMEAASRGFVSVEERRGLCIGILPRSSTGRGPKNGYPNPCVELPIYTHLVGKNPRAADSRNPINVLSASCVVALPGQKGTLAEAAIAVEEGVPILAVVDDRSNRDAPFTEAIAEIGIECLATSFGVEGFYLSPMVDFILATPARASGFGS